MAAKTRGPTGEVRGLPATTVRDLFLDALEHLAPGDKFTRMDFRALLVMVALEGKLKLEQEDVMALEHAFWRTVVPVPVTGERGCYLLPDHAEALVRHRLYRVSAGRYGLPDIMQLVALLQHAVDSGIALTPTLAGQLSTGSAALRALQLPATGKARRV